MKKFLVVDDYSYEGKVYIDIDHITHLSKYDANEWTTIHLVSSREKGEVKIATKESPEELMKRINAL